MDNAGAAFVRLLLPSGGPGAVRAFDDSDSGGASPDGPPDRLDKHLAVLYAGCHAAARIGLADFERSGWLAAQLLERQLRSPSARPQLAVFGDSAVVVRPSLGLFAKRDATVFRAIEFIRLNACGAIGVEDVARKMGCCRRSAEQRFKRTTGHSISDELLAVRLSKAKALLSDARIPIEHVHAACGYRDGRSLRYVFARATGMSLRDWRAKNQLRASSANPLRGGIP